MLDGLAAQTHAARRGDRHRQRQHRPHARGARRAHRPAAPRDHLGDQPRRRRWLPPRRAGGVRRGPRPRLADGRRRGARARLPGGADGGRRGLPDRRARGPRRHAGREGRHRLRPAQPARHTPQALHGRHGVRRPRLDARAGRGAERRLRGLHGPTQRHRRDRLPRPGLLHLLRRRRVRRPRPPRRSPCLGGARRRARPAARLQPAARPAGWKGFYMYRNLFVVHLRHGENAAGPVQAVADHPRGGPAEPGPRRAGRGPQRDPRHGLGAGDAPPHGVGNPPR